MNACLINLCQMVPPTPLALTGVSVPQRLVLSL